ncbi:MAG: hypothetical protein WCI78_02545 [Mycobacterium sp.]
MRIPLIVRILSVTFASAIAAAGCSTAPDYAAPASFTVSNEAVADVVNHALSGTPFAAPQDGSPTVDCSGATTCAIAYRVKDWVGYIKDVELLLPTRQMWKAMFADPNFLRGTITVSAPTETLRGKAVSPLVSVACARGAASHVDWDAVDAAGLKAACEYTEQILMPFIDLHGPTGVAVDPAGNLFVADSGNNRLLRLPNRVDPMGSPLAGASDVPLGVVAPIGVAVMAGDVYAIDGSRVLKLPLGAQTPMALALTIPTPTGVAVDVTGDVYVAEGETGHVFALTAWSAVPAQLPFEGALGGWSGGVAVDGKGNVYAAGSGGVWELRAGKNSPAKLSFGEMQGPHGVAVDIQGTVYVTDGADNGRVLALAAGATKPVVLPFTQLSRPTGVAVDAAGNVYVVDSGNNRVLEMPMENVPIHNRVSES